MAILPTVLSAEEAQLFGEEALAEKLAALAEQWQQLPTTSRAERMATLFAGLHLTGRALPPWLAAGLLEVVRENAGVAASIHEIRWLIVLRLREQGVIWDEVYKEASKQLEGTPGKGAPETIRRSYKMIRKDYGPGYKMAKDSFREALGEAGGKRSRRRKVG
jgi:hypothetical protein